MTGEKTIEVHGDLKNLSEFPEKLKKLYIIIHSKFHSPTHATFWVKDKEEKDNE